MNWANRLTVARLFLTLAFVITLSVRFPFFYTASLVIFVCAGITDYIDGEIARRFSIITDFGKLMDPLVDKIMMASAFICLVPLGVVPAWAATVIVSREFLITGLRLLASAKGRVLAAESMGKHKTAWQIATVVFFLALLALRECVDLGGGRVPQWYASLWHPVGTGLLMIAVALTLTSGAGYFWKNRGVIQME